MDLQNGIEMGMGMEMGIVIVIVMSVGTWDGNGVWG